MDKKNIHTKYRKLKTGIFLKKLKITDLSKCRKPALMEGGRPPPFPVFGAGAGISTKSIFLAKSNDIYTGKKPTTIQQVLGEPKHYIYLCVFYIIYGI
jgi:hypothetical protein